MTKCVGILRQDEDPRFGQEAAVFLRHVVAKYIEKHNATVHNDPLARYTMNVGMSELTKLAAADQLEREYLNRLEMTLRACRGQSERVHYEKTAQILYAHAKLETTRSVLLTYFPHFA